MTDKIKVGDYVRLKSGGPPMVVTLDNIGQYRCEWNDPDSGERGHWFFHGMVQKLSPAEQQELNNKAYAAMLEHCNKLQEEPEAPAPEPILWKLEVVTRRTETGATESVLLHVPDTLTGNEALQLLSFLKTWRY